MTVKEINVKTGEVKEREYTQDELDNITASQPTQEEAWKMEMAISDALITPRLIEEILDHLVNGTPISQYAKDIVSERKAKRAEKP